ncbi:hypothetical protein [Massilia scottii]|uniref:hypothetical protein n=1 Tax=Massilia scottii TaxID=3057166 RepID=UPI002796C778|nr:hypothetical protein [Massilia sp. CCM 9029]MDQ1832153.1 hypothetical protein [Massilia sp. CCM 9029]
MSKSPQRHAPLMFLTAMLVLSACSDKSKEVASENTKAADTAVEEVADNEPDLPTADYFAPILATAEGTYSECEAIGTGAATESKAGGPVVVAANGKASGAGIAGEVTADMDVLLVRQREGNAAPTLAMTVQNEKFMLSLMEHDDGKKQAGFGMQPNVVQCKVTKPIKLSSQSLYASYAYLMDAKTTIKCLNSGTLNFDDVAYQVAKGVLKIGDETYDLNTLKMETVNIGSDKRMSYLGQTPDDRSIMVFLDPQGKVSNLQVNGKGDKAFACAVRP